MENILLVIATVCVVILTGALITVFVIGYKILTDLRDVIRIVRKESEFIASDIHEFRGRIKSKAETASKVAGLLAVGRTASSIIKLMSGKK